jgi:TonB family protein
MRAAICFLLLRIASDFTLAKEPESSQAPVKLTPAQAARLSAYTPKPEYPPAARLSHIKGFGIFRLYIEPQSGTVTAVQVDRSTGDTSLDAAATRTLRHWRFKPDVMRAYRLPHEPSGLVIVRVPIGFGM